MHALASPWMMGVRIQFIAHNPSDDKKHGACFQCNLTSCLYLHASPLMIVEFDSKDMMTFNGHHLGMIKGRGQVDGQCQGAEAAALRGGTSCCQSGVQHGRVFWAEQLARLQYGSRAQGSEAAVGMQAQTAVTKVKLRPEWCAEQPRVLGWIGL